MDLLFPHHQIEIMNVAIYENAPDWIWKRSGTDYFNLWLALEGLGTVEQRGQLSSFAPGYLRLFTPSDPIMGIGNNNLRIVNFTAHIKAHGKAEAILKKIASESSPVQLRHFIWASHFCRYLSEAFYLNRKESEGLVISGLEMLLQSMHYEKALPPSDPVHELLMQSIGRIRRNPAAAYTVGEMAATAHLSTAQFTRRFKGITGMTPNRFIVEERLGRAESYLRETDLSIQEIASRLGYQDVYFFSRQFRRFRGLPPSRVRNSERRVTA